MKVFSKIKYLGGYKRLSTPGNIDIKIDKGYKCLRITDRTSWSGGEYLIRFQDITNISFDEKSKRSVGKAVTGAVIGGVLTGGIGLLAGGAIGARKKDDSTLYITIEESGVSSEMLLKPGKKTQEFYASLVSSMS